MSAKRGLDFERQPTADSARRGLPSEELGYQPARARRSAEPPLSRASEAESTTLSGPLPLASQRARRAASSDSGERKFTEVPPASAAPRELLVVPPLAVLEDETPTVILPRAALSEPRQEVEPAPVGLPRTVMVMLGIGLILALVVSLLPSQARPQPPEVPVLTSISKVCPGQLDGQGAGTLFAVVPSDGSSASGQVVVRGIGETTRHLVDDKHELIDTSLVTPLAASSVSAGVLSQRDQQTFWAACRTPGTDQFLQAPTSQGARLQLVNPDELPAIVDVTITSEDGEVTPPGLRNINLAGRSTSIVNLEDLLTTQDAIGLRVRVTNGRVFSGLRIANPDGGDYARAAQAGRQVRIPAVPAGSSTVRLLVSNPGTTRLTVRLTAFGAAGSYQLAGLDEIVVDPRRTQSFDLSAATAGDPISLQLIADQDFAASIYASQGNDFALVAGHGDARNQRATELVSVLPEQGELLVANSGSQDDTVTIDWGAGQATSQRPLPAGGLMELAVPSGAKLVRVSASQPVTGAVVINSDGGIAVAPLEVGLPSRSAQLMPDPHIG